MHLMARLVTCSLLFVVAQKAACPMRHQDKRALQMSQKHWSARALPSPQGTESMTDVLTAVPACSTISQPCKFSKGHLGKVPAHFCVVFPVFCFSGEMYKSALPLRPPLWFLGKHVFVKTTLRRGQLFPHPQGADAWGFCVSDRNTPGEGFWKG